jgi:hypothetical protein
VDLTAQQAADELKNSLTVDKSGKEATKPPATKAAKPAASKAKAGGKAKAKVETDIVDNSSQPDDQTFGSGD